MKYLFWISLSIVALPSQAQIVNSMSANGTGMYFNCVDSVMSYFKSEGGLGDVYIRRSTGQKIDKFPFTTHGKEVHELVCDVDCTKKMEQSDLLLTLSDISIIRDQYSISIKVQQKRGKKLERFADYGYFFQFKYLAESQTYELRKVRKGIVL